MSTDKRPGMAVNEQKVAHHVSETREQAKQANYPSKPVPLHEHATTRKHPRVKRDEPPQK